MKIEGELNIYTAAQWKDALMSALHARSSMELDLTDVNEFDSAGMQVLLLARREAHASNKPFTLVSPNRCVMEALELCQLNGQFLIEGAPKTTTEAA